MIALTVRINELAGRIGKWVAVIGLTFLAMPGGRTWTAARLFRRASESWATAEATLVFGASPLLGPARRPWLHPLRQESSVQVPRSLCCLERRLHPIVFDHTTTDRTVRPRLDTRSPLDIGEVHGA